MTRQRLGRNNREVVTARTVIRRRENVTDALAVTKLLPALVIEIMDLYLEPRRRSSGPRHISKEE